MFFCQYWNTSSCLSGRHCNNNCWSNLLCLSSWKPYILYNICCFTDKNREREQKKTKTKTVAKCQQQNNWTAFLHALFCSVKLLFSYYFYFLLYPFCPFVSNFHVHVCICIFIGFCWRPHESRTGNLRPKEKRQQQQQQPHANCVTQSG